MILISVIFLACTASKKWKNNYITRKMTIIHEKYSISLDKIDFRTEGNEFVNKPDELLTRKDVKKNMAGYERIIAQIPDSISILDASDSVYTNLNKIKYILKNGLATPNKILLGPNYFK